LRDSGRLTMALAAAASRTGRSMAFSSAEAVR